MSTPLVKAVAHIFPNAEIDMLTIPQTRIVFQDNPYVNDVLLFDKRAKKKKLASFIHTVNQIRSRHYNIAISTSSSLTNALFMWLGGIPMRVGFAKQKLLTHPIVHQRGMHMRYRYLALARAFSKDQFDAQTELFWAAREEQQAKDIFKTLPYSNRSVVGIAPGSVWETKKWPKNYYAELVKKLDADNINVVLFGAPDERALCADIQQNSSAINIAGDLSITASAALIKKCDLMLVNDSAPLHMANAVQTSVFAFFGPTVERFGCYPYQDHDRIFQVEHLECRPCGKHGGTSCPQKHFKCMLDVLPEHVYQQVKNYVEKVDAQNTVAD